MRFKPHPPRPQLVCLECRERLRHRLLLLHAAEATIIVCEGGWESLPQWMRDGYERLREAGRQGLPKRREMVGDIRDFFEHQS